MKVLIIGGNSFVGKRLSHRLDADDGVDLTVLNRSGHVDGGRRARIVKGDRNTLSDTGLPRDWDAVFDFACFTQRHAEDALTYFVGARRYVFISSISVYDLGSNLREDDFDAAAYDLSTPETALGDPISAYQEGKRRAEAVFVQRAPRTTVLVRFPFILGPDDPTHRLSFHIKRVAAGQHLFVANLEARVSVIHADDACQFLWDARDKDFVGALNVASQDPVRLRDLIAQVEAAVGRAAILTDSPEEGAISPYGPPVDFWVNVDRLRSLDLGCRPAERWLPELVRATH